MLELERGGTGFRKPSLFSGWSRFRVRDAFPGLGLGLAGRVRGDLGWTGLKAEPGVEGLLWEDCHARRATSALSKLEFNDLELEDNAEGSLFLIQLTAAP
mmetsp:Transcript_82452/g.145494  ORF Transcript_82452/g.145494 Transcript_82452/m.145494 type:complete len:100 (+) Transcript_82452:1302-1601(+)